MASVVPQLTIESNETMSPKRRPQIAILGSAESGSRAYELAGDAGAFFGLAKHYGRERLR